jgi:hypothetical protein
MNHVVLTGSYVADWIYCRSELKKRGRGGRRQCKGGQKRDKIWLKNILIKVL